MFRITKIIILMLIISSAQGCIVAAVGAGVGAVKWANSKKHQAYNDYVISMQKINMKREEHHLKPEPIMSYKEYLDTNK